MAATETPTSPAEMFLAAAERMTVAVQVLAEDWQRMNRLRGDFNYGRQLEAERALALLLRGEGRGAALAEIRQLLRDGKLPIV